MSSNEKGSRGEVEYGSDELIRVVEGEALSAEFGGGTEPGLPYPLRRRGPDMHVPVVIAGEDAEVGVPMRVPVNTLEPCPMCGGGGTLPGSGRVPCERCSGSGAGPDVPAPSVARGAVRRQEPCSTCHGYGLITPHPCPECAGDGRIPVRRDVAVQVPPGVTDGSYLRLRGRGPAGPHRGEPGDIYVEVRVRAARRGLLARWRDHGE